MTCSVCSATPARRMVGCGVFCDDCKRLVARIKRRRDRAREKGRDTTLPGHTWAERVIRERRVDRLRAAAERIGIANKRRATSRNWVWPEEPAVPVASLWEAVR